MPLVGVALTAGDEMIVSPWAFVAVTTQKYCWPTVRLPPTCGALADTPVGTGKAPTTTFVP